MNNPVVKQIEISKGTLCIVCEKIIVEEESKLTKSKSSNDSMTLAAKVLCYFF